jgi:hypothetical protein
MDAPNLQKQESTAQDSVDNYNENQQIRALQINNNSNDDASNGSFTSQADN